jgi:hypothetical protein
MSTGVKKSKKSKLIILDTFPIKNKYKNETNHKIENDEIIRYESISNKSISNKSVSNKSVSNKSVSEESVSDNSEVLDEVPAELRSSEHDPKPFTGRYSALSGGRYSALSVDQRDSQVDRLVYSGWKRLCTNNQKIESWKIMKKMTINDYSNRSSL